MNLVVSALRRPLTVMVLILAVALGSFLAVGRSVFEQPVQREADGHRVDGDRRACRTGLDKRKRHVAVVFGLPSGSYQLICRCPGRSGA